MKTKTSKSFQKMIVETAVNIGLTAEKSFGIESLIFTVCKPTDIPRAKPIHGRTLSLLNSSDYIIVVSKKLPYSNPIVSNQLLDMGIAVGRMMHYFDSVGVDAKPNWSFSKRFTGDNESISIALSFGKSKNPFNV